LSNSGFQSAWGKGTIGFRSPGTPVRVFRVSLDSVKPILFVVLCDEVGCIHSDWLTHPLQATRFPILAMQDRHIDSGSVVPVYREKEAPVRIVRSWMIEHAEGWDTDYQ